MYTRKREEVLNMRRSACILLAFILLIACMCGGMLTGANAQSSEYKTKIQDLAHSKIGVVTGGLQAIMLPQMLPEAEFLEFNLISDAAAALVMGKIDSFSAEDSVYRTMKREGQPFARIDEPFMLSNYGMIFGKGLNPQLQEEFNDFLSKCRENGTLEAQTSKWFGDAEPQELLPTEGQKDSARTLTLAIESAQKPYSYIKNGQFTGFDVELVALFAQEYGYALKVEDVSFGGILTGVSQGKYDMGASGITITEERKQTLDFSDPYLVEEVVMVVKGEAERSLSEFQNATLGVIDGSLYAGFSKELFPNARIDYYTTFTDLFQCVKQGKIDGFLMDIPNFNAVRRTDANLDYLTVPGYSVDIGIAFGKNPTGERLQAQMNEFLAAMRADGRHDQLWEKWCGVTEPAQPPKTPEFAADAQTLKVVLDLSRKPFVYLLNNEYAGYEVELMYEFCQTYGYKPEFETAQWTSGVAGLKEEKYDVVCCGIYMTDERRESVNFCDPYCVADVIMVVYEEGESTVSTWESIKASFDKTFIREDRWKLIVQGIWNTLIISVFAVIGGTVLGFGLYLLARCGISAVSWAAKAFGRVYGRIVAGTPTLVVLMILFYVIFGKSNLDGLYIAVLGFAITFGSFVYSHLTLCVDGIDRGQTEAAYALGYTRNQTFFRVILPQSMKNFLPTYTGEVIGLIKATSVVGYIAVSDLTKMGDIIRSNTYEAVFPLLAVAVIYFIITWGAAALLGLVQKKMDTHRRKPGSILKGVVR